MNKMISKHSPSSVAFRSIGLFAVLWFTFAVFSPALAQMVPSSESTETGIEIPEDLTQQQARDLIARLSDEEVREIVIRQLDKLASESEQKADPTVYVSQLQTGIKVAKNSLKRILTADHQMGALPAMIWRKLTENGRVSGWILLMQLIALMVAGVIAEGLVRRLLGQAGSRAAEIQSPGTRFNLACYEMIKGMIGLGAFAAGAILLIEFTSPQMKSAQSFWYQVLWCLILLKLVVLAVRVLVSPGRSDNRLVTVSDSTAQQMLAWSLLVAGSLVLPRPLVAIATDFGADTDTALLLSMVFGTLFIALLIVLIVRLRRYGAALILGGSATAATAASAAKRRGRGFSGTSDTLISSDRCKNLRRGGKERGGESYDRLPAVRLQIIARLSASGCGPSPAGQRSRSPASPIPRARARRKPSSSKAGKPGSYVMNGSVLERGFS